MKNDRKYKSEKQKELYQKEEMKKQMIQEMRRDLSIQKGPGDPYAINPINYSQVEESPPKYSIKGKYEIHEVRNDDPGNLVLGVNPEQIELIKELQKNQPQPNYNYVKPKLPSTIFCKAERFPKIRNQYEDSVLLFEDGIFQPNTRQDFMCKEPMDNSCQRSKIVPSDKDKTPSPAHYEIKSNFDVIVKEGKKISSIQDKIKNHRSMELKKKYDKKENAEKNNSDIVLVLQND